MSNPSTDQLADPPFRLEVRRASNQEVTQINEQEGYTYSRKLEPAQQAIERAQTAQTATRDRLLSWIYHPDERVPMAMIDNQGTRYPRKEVWRDEAEFVGQHLLRRAWLEARQEGHLWTPILDKMSTRSAHLWPDRLQFTEEERNNPDHPIRQISGNEFPLGKARRQYRKLIPWIRQDPEPEKLLKLFEFQEERLAGLVGRCTPDPSVDLIQAALQKDVNRGRWFAYNEDLGDHQQDFLVRRAHEFIEEDSTYFPEAEIGDGTLLLRGLSRHDEWESSQEIQTHLATLLIQREGDFEYKDKTLFGALTKVGADKLSLEQLKKLYRRIENDSEAVIDLLRSCWGHEEFWSFVAEDSSLFKVRDWLSQTYTGRRVERIRDVLKSSRSGEVLERLMEDSRHPEEKRELFKRIRQHHPERAIQLAEELTPEELEDLGTEELARLLRLEDPELRQQAMRAVSRSSSTPPETHSSRKR